MMERIREGQRRAGMPKKGGCNKFLNWLKFCMYLLLLLLPTTKRQEGEGVATVIFDQRVVVVLE
jgi:hypothetical protein